ncbi:NAD-dependent epimerase/dehydratase family protein [Candidatus Woesearchaeota archaeon]|nr:NAD-dependent epimerase/dehydratase family protein [Candidatus Woesearchaeota archaeon]
MVKIIVTGGAGFIGSHVVEELVKNKYEVKVIDNLSNGSLNNLGNVKDKIEFVKSDITDMESLNKEFRDADFVLHYAALKYILESIENPVDYHNVNINGTYNVLEASRRNKIKGVLFAGSSVVYGENPVLPLKENFVPMPKSTYAVTKLFGEYYCRLFSENYGLRTVILRYSNVFGPRQDINSEYAAAVPKFISRMIKDESPIIWGEGIKTRDFVYVKNIVDANINILKNDKFNGEIINIGSGVPTNINELVAIINHFLNKNIKAKYVLPFEGDLKHNYLDVSKANDLIGYTQLYDLNYGINETIEWIKEKQKQKITL